MKKFLTQRSRITLGCFLALCDLFLSAGLILMTTNEKGSWLWSAAVALQAAAILFLMVVAMYFMYLPVFAKDIIAAAKEEAELDWLTKFEFRERFDDSVRKLFKRGRVVLFPKSKKPH
ncbi:MAG: hypothetical protein G01um101430_237 [Parcubacteria group bacterium Gr01-1014_30]|nr:MAG: hypothetical protein G01um101430_237 [Parcubacteria group bacterium Gr01-1014_30]